MNKNRIGAIVLGIVIVLTRSAFRGNRSAHWHRPMPSVAQRPILPDQSGPPDQLALGTEALENKQYDRAVECFDEAVHNLPKDWHAHFGQGQAYDGRKDYDKAIASYNEVIRLAPVEAGPYLSRGYAYARKKDLKRAIADYNGAIRLNPKNSEYYLVRGTAYSEQGDYTLALRDHMTALHQDPKSTAAYRSRGSVDFAQEPGFLGEFLSKRHFT